MFGRRRDFLTISSKKPRSLFGSTPIYPFSTQQTAERPRSSNTADRQAERAEKSAATFRTRSHHLELSYILGEQGGDSASIESHSSLSVVELFFGNCDILPAYPCRCCNAPAQAKFAGHQGRLLALSLLGLVRSRVITWSLQCALLPSFIVQFSQLSLSPTQTTIPHSLKLQHLQGPLVGADIDQCKCKPTR